MYQACRAPECSLHLHLTPAVRHFSFKGCFVAYISWSEGGELIIQLAKGVLVFLEAECFVIYRYVAD